MIKRREPIAAIQAEQGGRRRDVSPTKSLPWTGERYVPELHGTIALEHLHRYAMAAELSVGRSVLDVACGEGYGSSLLSRVANSVIGIDADEETVLHAHRRYANENAHFVIARCENLPVKSRSIDVVASFETIEHVNDHDAMLSEIKRVLRLDGVLVISSPNKDEFSMLANEQNPFHVKELSRGEFHACLTSRFKHVTFFGQRVTYGSSIFAEDAASAPVTYAWDGDQATAHRGVYRPQFLVAAASDRPIPAVSSGLFEPVIPNSDYAPFWPTAAERGRLQQLQTDLDAVLNSISWRLTAPFRAAAAIVRSALNFMRRDPAS
jgi:O-antigen biosynthesis protein